MEIIVDKDKKLVEVWLSRIESAAPETEAALKLIYDEYSKMKCKMVVFRRGAASIRRKHSPPVRHRPAGRGCERKVCTQSNANAAVE